MVAISELPPLEDSDDDLTFRPLGEVDGGGTPAEPAPIIEPATVADSGCNLSAEHGAAAAACSGSQGVTVDPACEEDAKEGSADSSQSDLQGWASGACVLALEDVKYGRDFVKQGDGGKVLGPHPTKRGKIKVVWDGDEYHRSVFFHQIINEDQSKSIWGPGSICGLWNSERGHIWICPHEADSGSCVYHEAPLEGGFISGVMRQINTAPSPPEADNCGKWWFAEVAAEFSAENGETAQEKVGEVRLQLRSANTLRLQTRAESGDGDDWHPLSQWSESREFSRYLPRLNSRTGPILTSIAVSLEQHLQPDLEVIVHKSITLVSSETGCVVRMMVEARDPDATSLSLHYAAWDEGVGTPSVGAVLDGMDAFGHQLSEGRCGVAGAGRLWWFDVCGLRPNSRFDLHMVCTKSEEVDTGYPGIYEPFTLRAASRVITVGVVTSSHAWFWQDDSGSWRCYNLSVQERLELTWNSMREQDKPTSAVLHDGAGLQSPSTPAASAAAAEVSSTPRKTSRATSQARESSPQSSNTGKFNAVVAEDMYDIDVKNMEQRHRHTGRKRRIARRAMSLHEDAAHTGPFLSDLCKQYKNLVGGRHDEVEYVPKDVSDCLNAACQMQELVAAATGVFSAEATDGSEISRCSVEFAKAQEAVQVASDIGRSVAEQTSAPVQAAAEREAANLEESIRARDLKRRELHTLLDIAAARCGNLRQFVHEARACLSEQGAAHMVRANPAHCEPAAEGEPSLKDSQGLQTMLAEVRRRLQREVRREYRLYQKRKAATDEAKASALGCLRRLASDLEGTLSTASADSALPPVDDGCFASFSRCMAEEVDFHHTVHIRRSDLDDAVRNVFVAASQQLEECVFKARGDLAIVSEYERLRDVHAAMMQGLPSTDDLCELEEAMYSARNEHTDALEAERRLKREMERSQRWSSTAPGGIDERLSEAQGRSSKAKKTLHQAERDYRRRVLQLQSLKRSHEGFPELRLPLPEEDEEIFDHLFAGRRRADYDDLKPMSMTPGRCTIFRGSYAGEACVLKEVRSLSRGRELQRELAARKRLSHTLVVPVLAAFEEEDDHIRGHFTAYLHMPLYPWNLEDWASSEVCSAPKIRQALCDILAVVAHVHAQGLIHGDLKPSNFLVNPQGQPCLTDFELCRTIASPSASKAENVTTTVVGFTPAFMAPEFPELTAASDVFALGGVCKKMLECWQQRWPTDCPFERHLLDGIAARMQQEKPGDRPTAAEALRDLARTASCNGPAPDTGFPPYWQTTSNGGSVKVAVDNHEVLQWPNGVTTWVHMSTAIDQTSHIQCLLQGPRACSGGMVVRKVDRLECPQIWHHYCVARAQVVARGLPPAIVPPVRPQHPLISLACNEYWLWHGTRRANLDAIMAEGLDEHMSQLSGLYGAGIYFSDEACKALQYTDISDGHPACLLYCRVILGRPYFTRNTLGKLRTPKKLLDLHRERGLEQVPDAGGHDTIVVNPGPIHGHPNSQGQVHREFVVFDGALVYPEFVVTVEGRQHSSR